MDIKSIVVIGNRDISRSIISALPTLDDERPPYRLSLLTYPYQNPYLPTHVPAESIEHKVSDFDFASLQRALTGQDLVISTIAGGYELQACIIDVIVAAGVKRFMPYEFVKSVVQCWDTIKNQYLYVAGMLTAGNELVGALERMTKSKWSVGYSDVEDCI